MNKEEKFIDACQKLSAYLWEEAGENEMLYNSMVVGAVNGILMRENLENKGKHFEFTTDITDFLAITTEEEVEELEEESEAA